MCIYIYISKGGNGVRINKRWKNSRSTSAHAFGYCNFSCLTLWIWCFNCLTSCPSAAGEKSQTSLWIWCVKCTCKYLTKSAVWIGSCVLEVRHQATFFLWGWCNGMMDSAHDFYLLGESVPKVRVSACTRALQGFSNFYLYTSRTRIIPRTFKGFWKVY